MVLDQWVATENMDAASTYFEFANPKYKRFSPRGPNQPPEPKENTGATLRHLQCMMVTSNIRGENFGVATEGNELYEN